MTRISCFFPAVLRTDGGGGRLELVVYTSLPRLESAATAWWIPVHYNYPYCNWIKLPLLLLTKRYTWERKIEKNNWTIKHWKIVIVASSERIDMVISLSRSLVRLWLFQLAWRFILSLPEKNLKRNNFFPVEATARVFQQYCGGNQLSSLKSAQTRAHQKRTIKPCVILLNVEPSQQWRAQLYKNKCDRRHSSEFYQKGRLQQTNKQTIPKKLPKKSRQTKNRTAGRRIWTAQLKCNRPQSGAACDSHTLTHTRTHTHTHCWRRARASWLLHKKTGRSVGIRRDILIDEGRTLN